MRNYIPGNPTIVLEHRAAWLASGQDVYQVAKPDGLTIGALSGRIVALHVLGATGVMYDIDNFMYLGVSESTSHQILYTRKELAWTNPEKLRAAFGHQDRRPGDRGHPLYCWAAVCLFLGFKEPKFIVGYTTPEIEVALLRGELDGRANNVAQLLHRNPDWVEKSVMDIQPCWRFRKKPSIRASVGSPRSKVLRNLKISQAPHYVRTLDLWACLTLCLRERRRTGS